MVRKEISIPSSWTGPYIEAQPKYPYILEYMMNTPFSLSWFTNKGCISPNFENLYDSNVCMTPTISFSPCSLNLWRLRCNSLLCTDIATNGSDLLVNLRHLSNILDRSYMVEMSSHYLRWESIIGAEQVKVFTTFNYSPIAYYLKNTHHYYLHTNFFNNIFDCDRTITDKILMSLKVLLTV